MRKTIQRVSDKCSGGGVIWQRTVFLVSVIILVILVIIEYNQINVVRFIGRIYRSFLPATLTEHSPVRTRYGLPYLTCVPTVSWQTVNGEVSRSPQTCWASDSVFMSLHPPALVVWWHWTHRQPTNQPLYHHGLMIHRLKTPAVLLYTLRLKLSNITT